MYGDGTNFETSDSDCANIVLVLSFKDFDYVCRKRNVASIFYVDATLNGYIQYPTYMP